MTNAQSLEKLQSWKREFINQGGIDNGDQFPFIVVGNKADRSDKNVDTEEVEAFCGESGNMKSYECSAKEGTGIAEAMEEVVRQAAMQKKLEEEEIFIPRDIDLGNPKPVPTNGNCTC